MLKKYQIGVTQGDGAHIFSDDQQRQPGFYVSKTIMLGTVV
jgi:hypothetical protein